MHKICIFVKERKTYKHCTNTDTTIMSKIIKQISTHKAVQTAKNIQIILKGFKIGSYECKDELLYTIPNDQLDDVFSIMERHSEDNRINLAEANNSFNY